MSNTYVKEEQQPTTPLESCVREFIEKEYSFKELLGHFSVLSNNLLAHPDFGDFTVDFRYGLMRRHNMLINFFYNLESIMRDIDKEKEV